MEASIQNQVIHILAENLEISPGDIHPDTELTALVTTSLKLLKIIGKLERHFDIHVPEDDIFSLEVVDDLCAFVDEQVSSVAP